jgi:putative heme-binding domain-containing protein
VPDAAIQGETSVGENFFWGEGCCGTCHTVHGKGSSLGPDLSDAGHKMTSTQLHDLLLHPDLHITTGYHLATVKTRDGKTMEGFLRGRSNYDVQLQDLSGALHFLDAREISSLSEENRSLMKPLPASTSRLDDLTAYLSQLSGVEQGSLEAPNSYPAPASEHFDYSQILHPHGGDWPTYNGKEDANRYSSLKQIDKANVYKLALQWTFPLSQLGLEATPLVVAGIMYFSGQNQVYAFDALTGRQIWMFSRLPTPGLVGDASFGLTGSLMSDVFMPEEPERYGSTVAPLIVNNTVITGVSGGDWGMRGFVASCDAATGKLLWRHWTLPGRGDPGIETRGRNPPLLSGGSTWLSGSYDPETDTLYWPTGNPFPDSDDSDRPGDNLYTDCVLALDPYTGNMEWYFQFTPHDTADRGANEPPVLIDAIYQGTPRKLLLHADRNGFLYILDRTTGKLLLAKAFLNQINWATGIGPDGRPQLAVHPATQSTRERKCPDNAANWSSTAYSPATRLYYVMTLEECRAPDQADGAAPAQPLKPLGRYLRAIEIDTGKIAWEIPQFGPTILKTWSGVLGTASGILFYSDPNGAFVAADERTGKTFWHFDTNVVMKGPPMTYKFGDRQFVAVTAGSVLLSFALPQHIVQALTSKPKNRGNDNEYFAWY